MQQRSSSMFGRLADVLENVENDWSVVAARTNCRHPAAGGASGFCSRDVARQDTRALRVGADAGRVRHRRSHRAGSGYRGGRARVLIEGPAGLLAIAPPWNRPIYEPSKRRVTWVNGAIVTSYSAEEPEPPSGPAARCGGVRRVGGVVLRGSLAHAHARPTDWEDASVRGCHDAETVRLLRELLAREGKDVAVTRGSTFENRRNLAPALSSRCRLATAAPDSTPGTQMARCWMTCPGRFGLARPSKHPASLFPAASAAYRHRDRPRGPAPRKVRT